MHLNNNRGFTLFELIIAMSIMSIVMAMLFSYLLYNSKLYSMTHNDATIQRQCTEILERLTVDAKESAALDDTQKAAGIYIFDKTPDVGADVSVVFDEILCTLTIDGATPPYDNISSFSIDKVAGYENLLKIEVAGRIKDSERHFSTTVSMRNQ